MLFQNIPGREKTKERIRLGVGSGKIPGTQLFSSSEGSGGLALAIAYAQYVMCTNRTEEDSCGKCSSCLKISRLIHPDLHFSFPFSSSKKEDSSNLFMASFRSLMEKNPFFSLEDWTHELAIENKMVNIPISECRQILRELSLKPYEANYQILILWLPEFLRENANSLLKLFEEPSPGTIILLVTENRDLILPTLLSRAQSIYLETPKLEEIRSYLQEKFDLDSASAETIAQVSEGNLSIAFSNLTGAVDQFKDTFLAWVQVIKEGNGFKIVEWVDMFNGKTVKTGFTKEEKKNFILYSLKMFRDQYFGRFTENQRLVHNPSRVAESFEGLTAFSKITQELEKAAYHLERNSNPKILLLDVSLQLCQILKT